MTVVLTTLLGWDVRNPKDDPPAEYARSNGEWPEVDLVDDAPPTAHIGRALAQRLQAVMDEKDLSTRGVAAAAGCTHPTISRILDGTGLPDTRTVFLLEVALQVPLWPHALYSRFTLRLEK
ncbi:helix-turn-helix transcriptional regulator [Streptomyces sp. GMY02]|uniref:helix-turn-helix domain-containing protein n=1 Tax=Streptomyces sp. GMY02 TaxID=1333528 RepID=UPI001C2C79AA|nr:helix-turn-helix transcriptional regulator [Streptomyces sp. GMY02]QXE38154.1 helix-turn-helix transcriptional regulator [Streptomyces sp. GMY02]